jgi:hypothetical protein
MSLHTKLLLLSPWLIFFLINLVFVGISLALLFFIRLCCHYQVRQRHNDVASAIFNRAGAIHGIILAFVVIVMWQQYDKAYEDALKEGAEARELYRDLSLYPRPAQVKGALDSITRFVHLVVEEEYPAMRVMKTSPATEEAVNALWSDTLKINPQSPQEQILYSKIIRTLESLTKLRESRLIQMDTSLPPLIWLALITGTLITMVFSSIFGAEKLWLHALLAAMLAVIIGTTYFLIVQLDYPFMGAISVEPSSYKSLLETMGGGKSWRTAP